MTEIEINKEFKQAYELLENTNNHVFLTWKAGTWKSTFLEYFRFKTKKKTVFLAPTWVAAVNIKWETIHHFFWFKPNITLDKIKSVKSNEMYQSIDLIVIDEISMVRSDLLDCIDLFLRKNAKWWDIPFGWVQIAFIWDMYQLPPVLPYHERRDYLSMYKSEYFFDSKVFQELPFEMIELKKMYRQNEQEFIDILNWIRDKTINRNWLDKLNSRFKPDYKRWENNHEIYLTTTNLNASLINDEELDILEAREYYLRGFVSDDFPESALPTDELLNLKVWSQVMILVNDPIWRYYNWSIWKVLEINEDEMYIDIELENKEKITLNQFGWDMFNYEFDKKSKILKSTKVWTFTQYPLKLAWAVTIHKAQGKTFKNVIIDIWKWTFAHWQMYVALSRATELSWIVLKQQIQFRNIIMDFRVSNFMKKVKEWG